MSIFLGYGHTGSKLMTQSICECAFVWVNVLFFAVLLMLHIWNRQKMIYNISNYLFARLMLAIQLNEKNTSKCVEPCEFS